VGWQRDLHQVVDSVCSGLADVSAQGYVLAHTYAAVHVFVPVARAVGDGEDCPLGAWDRSTRSGYPVQPGAESCDL